MAARPAPPRTRSPRGWEGCRWWPRRERSRPRDLTEALLLGAGRKRNPTSRTTWRKRARIMLRKIRARRRVRQPNFKARRSFSRNKMLRRVRRGRLTDPKSRLAPKSLDADRLHRGTIAAVTVTKGNNSSNNNRKNSSSSSSNSFMLMDVGDRRIHPRIHPARETEEGRRLTTTIVRRRRAIMVVATMATKSTTVSASTREVKDQVGPDKAPRGNTRLVPEVPSIHLAAAKTTEVVLTSTIIPKARRTSQSPAAHFPERTVAL